MLDPRKGMSKAHEWTRGVGKAPPMPTEVKTTNGILTSPKDLGEHYVQQWSQLWTKATEPNYNNTVEQLYKLYKICKTLLTSQSATKSTSRAKLYNLYAEYGHMDKSRSK